MNIASAAILGPSTHLVGPHRVPVSVSEERQAKSRDLISLAALSVIAIGVIWRLLRYALAFPIWGDEAMFALNLVSRDFADVLEPLENGQVAPALFILGEWASYQFLGPSEYAMRFLPLLAGVFSLPLFWMFARTLLPRRTALFAVAILSVSIWPVSMSSLIKPYSADLFWTLTLLVPAAKLLHEPRSIRWWFLLIITTPFALLGSFPALFVSAGVGLSLTILTFRLRSFRATALLGVLGVVTFATFAFNYLYVITQTPTVTQNYMEWYWRSGFPPSNPFEFVFWFVKAHVSQTFAYPIGAANGGSTATFLVALVGAVCLWRARRFDTLLLCLAPFVFSFLGAVLKKYPYGDSCRLAQHLAPAVCLLAAVGVNRALCRGDGYLRIRAGLALLLTLWVVGAVGIVRDCVKPFRGAEDQWNRQVVREIFHHVGPLDRVIVPHSPQAVTAGFQWYLINQSTTVAFRDEIAELSLQPGAGRIWCLELAFTFDRTWHPKEKSEAFEWATRTIEQSNSRLKHRVTGQFAYVQRGAKSPLIHFCRMHLWSEDDFMPLLAASAPNP